MGLVSDTRQELLIPALTYVVGSVVFGPAIFPGGYESITGGVMDYCDPVHGAPSFTRGEVHSCSKLSSPALCGLSGLSC
ncbi:hypothetical protein [Nocardia abscessus]|nr:hypothetical protein [Nocardia abscessus]